MSEDLYWLIERSWLGIFNNAVIKAYPSTATLQEFSVWNKDSKCIGRCDYLFRWENGGKKYDVITEVKQYESDGKWKYSQSEAFYQKIIEQARNYYEVESSHYPNEVLFLGLIFEWIGNDTQLKSLKPLLSSYPKTEDPFTDFIQLIHTERAGVVVYGNVEPLTK